MALQHTSFSKSFSPLRKVPGILSSASSENLHMKRSKRIAEHVRNISRCALRLSTRSIGVGTGDGRGEGPRKGCDAMQRNAGGKAGSIFKCTDLVQICACLPYRVVAQDGHSFEHTHHQDRLWSRVWNKITPNRALFNTCLGTIKNNTQFGMPSKLTPK